MCHKQENNITRSRDPCRTQNQIFPGHSGTGSARISEHWIKHHGNIKFFISEELRKLIGYKSMNCISCEILPHCLTV